MPSKQNDKFRVSKDSGGSVTAVRKGSKYDGGSPSADTAASKTLKSGVEAANKYWKGNAAPIIDGVQKFAAGAKKRK